MHRIKFDMSMFFYGSSGNEIMNYVKWWVDFSLHSRVIRVKIFSIIHGHQQKLMLRFLLLKIHLTLVIITLLTLTILKMVLISE